LPVIHALTGCNTTSSFFGLGKTSTYKELTRNSHSIAAMEVFNKESHDKHQIEEAGLKFISYMYTGELNVHVNEVRFNTYMNLVSCSTTELRPERLPPTEGAA